MRNSKAEYDAAIDVLLQLRAAFPEVISRLDTYRRRPLKIGIHRDVQDLLPEIDHAIVGIAMRLYTGHVGYLRSLVEGAARIDLDGAEVGTVTAEDAARARHQLENALQRAATKQAARAAAKESTHKEKLAAGIASLRASARNRAGRMPAIVGD